MEVQIPPAAATNGEQPPAGEHNVKSTIMGSEIHQLEGRHRGFAFVTFGTQIDVSFGSLIHHVLIIAI